MGKDIQRAVSILIVALTIAMPSSAWAADMPAAWAAVVEAAKKEKVVKCGCPPRPDFTAILKEGFEKANPGLTLEPTAAPLPAFPVRVGNEQKAGLYLWDIYMFGPGPEVFELKDKGGFDSFRDYIVLPEVLNGSVYTGGLDAAFLDREKKYIFSITYNVLTFGVNRDVLPDAKFTAMKDLLDPRYQGKIVWQDPRGGGSGSNWLAYIYQSLGEPGIKTMLVDQKPTLVSGLQELAEQMVRGGKAISLPMPTRDSLIQLDRAGVKYNIEPGGQSPDISHGSVGGSSPAIFKNAPHPNATKVFVNWLLSKDGQTLISKELELNSRRTDVPVVDPTALPKPGASYYVSQTEEGLALRLEAQKIARKLVP